VYRGVSLPLNLVEELAREALRNRNTYFRAAVRKYRRTGKFSMFDMYLAGRSEGQERYAMKARERISTVHGTGDAASCAGVARLLHSWMKGDHRGAAGIKMISGRVVGISHPGKIAYATGGFKARNMVALVKYLVHIWAATENAGGGRNGARGVL
jgi:hypothetical protein